MTAGRAIRVVIVDDVAESRDSVEKLLRFERDIQVVGKGATGREAVDLALKLQPDVILMDINMPDMDGITATTEITSQLPAVGVIMMSVQDEPETLRRSMLAGAREFLAKPFSFDDLISAVRHVAMLAQQAQRIATGPLLTDGTAFRPAANHARVFGVFSNKGGVGRTVVAVNLAVALRKLTQKDVVLVDGSLQFGDVSVLLNVSEGKTICDVVPQATSLDRELMDSILVTHANGIRLLLAPPTPQDAERVTVQHLQSAMTILTTTADYVVIDGRPGWDEAMLALMDISDRILLLLTSEMTAIKDTRQFLEIAELLGYPPERVEPVINRVNGFSGIPLADIAENLKCELEFRIPDEPAAVLRSVNEGAPLVETQPDNRFSLEVMRLAAHLAAEDLPVENVIAGLDPGRQRGARVFDRLRTALRHA